MIIVGERSGISATDSLGLYFTHDPDRGKADADRNCLSKIRPPQGLSYEAAALKLTDLVEKSLKLGYSGVALKDDMPPNLQTGSQHQDRLDPGHSDC